MCHQHIGWCSQNLCIRHIALTRLRSERSRRCSQEERSMERIDASNEAMRANDVRPDEMVRHGAYMCLSVPTAERRAAAGAAVGALADRLGLRNEFDTGD